MESKFLYSLFLLAGVILSLFFALYGWQRRPSRGARSFALLMLAASEWSLGYLLELASPDLTAALFWAKVQYLGITVLPVASLAFALEYSDRQAWSLPRNLAGLAVMPLVTLALVWTNEHHGFVWSGVGWDTTGAFPVLNLTHGFWFWVNLAYSYFLLMLGSHLIVWALVRSRRLQLFYGQIGAMLIGVLLPWIANILYIIDLSPFRGLDPTPLAFMASGLAFARGLFHYGLLNIVPVARDAIMEHMADGVLVLDAQDRIVDLNPAAKEIIDRKSVMVIGQPAELAIPDWIRIVELHHSETDSSIEVVQGEGERQRTFELHSVPLYDRHRRFAGRLLVLHDISVRVQARKALQKAKESAEEADRAKSVFLVHMSHELRTPLNAIIGFSELLQEETKDCECSSIGLDLEKIRVAGYHLLDVIGDVLDLSRIEAGKMALALDSFDLKSLIYNVMIIGRPLVEKNGNDLVVQLPDNLGSMYADEAKVRQVLINLVGNAAKFTAGGRISLTASREATGDDDGWIRFCVEDTGIGMSPEQAESLFQPFVQASYEIAAAYGGSGLGLAISQRICQIMGGEISVESELGTGTTFTVRLPVTVQGQKSP